MNYFIPLLSVLLISCAPGEKASFKYDDDFHKYSADLLISEIVTTPSQTSHILANIDSKVKSNFQWIEFWERISFELKNLNDLDSNDNKAIASLIANKCQDIPLETSYKILDYVSQDKDVINHVLLQERKMLTSCYLNRSELKTDKIKKIHSRILSLDSEELLDALFTVIDIDAKITENRNSAYGQFHSLTPKELSIAIEKVAGNSDLATLNKLLTLHKSVSSGSSRSRAILISRFIKNERTSQLIAEKASTKDIVDVLNIVTQENEIEISQENLKLLLNLAKEKFKEPFVGINKFDDLSQLLEISWGSYTSLFRVLNENIIEDKDFILRYFNDLGNTIESVFRIPDNRSLAVEELNNIEGDFKLLAIFHMLKIQSRELVVPVFQNYQEIYGNIDQHYLGLLEKLLLHRINIFMGTEDKQLENLEAYCSYLANEFKVPNKKKVNINNVSSLLNLNTYGCYELQHNRTLNELGEKPVEQADYYELTLNQEKIETPFDLVITSNDTNLSIKTNYYRGPIWNLSSHPERLHNQKTIEDQKLDAMAAPVAITFDVSELVEDLSRSRRFKKNKVVLFYNYAFKVADNAPDYTKIFDHNTLKPGYKGGDVELFYRDQKSEYPLILNFGGKGQQGPDILNAGEGFNAELSTKLSQNEFYKEYYLGNTLEKIYPNPSDKVFEKLSKYKYSVELNSPFTDILQMALCDLNESELRGNKICYKRGANNYSYSEFQLDDSQYQNHDHLYNEASDKIKNIFSLLKAGNTLSAKDMINKYFTLDPRINDGAGKTKFPNGAKGQKGTINFKAI